VTDIVAAHTWFNLAASRWKDEGRRVQAASLRDELEKTMTPDQRAAAYRRAIEWQDAHSCKGRVRQSPGLGIRDPGFDEFEHMTTTASRETLGFQAEVKQLLHLMVHSLYGNKEIFLRELVSNASDAGDKLRFEALADPALFESDPDLKIRVSFDKTARTITVSDNGIGMSRQEVIDQIGTIAKSGTREFFQSLTSDKAKDAHLIGQFGVGFYSAFIVADRVTLTTRRAGLGAGARRSLGEQRRRRVHRRDDRQRRARGTEVVLHCARTEDDLPRRPRSCARSSASTRTTSRCRS
jgi:hypothetical protein